MPDLPAPDGWRLRAQVPDGIFTLAVEADDETASEEHEAFADRCLPVLTAASGGTGDPTRLREEITSQLATLRRAVADSGLGYLGAVAGENEGRPALILLGVAGAAQSFPDGVDPASLLADTLRHRYPGAAVEEFDTADGTGVGIRRCDQLALPGADIDTGISQALVPFPCAGLLGSVTGFCFNAEDIDLATVFTATIAHHMTVVTSEQG
jgi:hypothetical protein